MHASQKQFSGSFPLEHVMATLSWSLQRESQREHASLHLLSSNVAEVRSLYRAIDTLNRAQSEIAQLLGVGLSQDTALTVTRKLCDSLREQISSEWRDHHFRASEALTRSLLLIVHAEHDLERRGQLKALMFGN
jgi:signal recognition particle GTPase